MRSLALIVLAFLSCLAFGRGASVRTDGGVLVVNGLPVVRFRPSVDVPLPEERAKTAAAILVSASSPDSISVRSDARGTAIVLGAETLITVYSKDGANGLAIANDWASRIKHALALPALKIGDDLVKVAVAGGVDVSVIGHLCEYVTANSMNRAVASVEKTPYGLRIKGESPGRTAITVGVGNEEDQSITVVVQPLAAIFPQIVTATVCGQPATAGTVEGAITGAIRTQLKSEDGSVIDFRLRPVNAIGAGQSRTITVEVHASAFQSIESTGEVRVRVTNVMPPIATDEVLWYSNDPESVRNPGPLFMSTLEPSRSARLLYHHLNASTIPMLMRVQAINNSDAAIELMIISGDSKPDKNPVRAGMRAAIEYLPANYWGSGEVITIPPRSTLPLSLRRFSPGETVSGLCSVRVISGTGLTVRTDVWPPLALEQKWRNAILTSTPWREVGAHPINEFDRAPCEQSVHVYPNPYKDLECRYSVGGRFGTIRLGEAPIATADSHNNLDGNYGVMYSIRATISNPTNHPAEVELILESSSGYTTGLFIVDGKTYCAPYLGPKDTSRIVRFSIPAGATVKSSILTVPISGGSYPVTMTLRPISKNR